MTTLDWGGIAVGVFLGLIAAVCSYTVSKRYVFQALRRWATLTGREWIKELVTCHWCLSFWFSFGFTLLAFPTPLHFAEGFWIPESIHTVIEFLFAWFWAATVSTLVLSLTLDRVIRHLTENKQLVRNQTNQGKRVAYGETVSNKSIHRIGR